MVVLYDRLRGQVEEVVDVMKDNVTKVIERGDRLEDLQDKSGRFTFNLVMIQ
jgi:vesicle-associated membrane protein 4